MKSKRSIVIGSGDSSSSNNNNNNLRNSNHNETTLQSHYPVKRHTLYQAKNQAPQATGAAYKMLLFSFTILIIIQQVHTSGIFELNLSALTDAYGRDLRLDCCAWQNASQEKQQQQQQVLAGGMPNNLMQTINSVSSGRYAAATAAAATAESCDPTKCQLIIRICVKNYQTQIDPSQCTFGELSAQVMRPDESGRLHLNGHHHHAGHMSSFARLQQQQQMASFQKARLAAGQHGGIVTNLNSTYQQQQQQQQAINKHQQRMLQQLLQAPYQATATTSSEQHARRLYQGPSGQARSMRQIAFDQPISFPFNFTWPVSSWWQ
jgi:hypothetical protein